MATYLKNSTDYGFYFLESDSSANDDWITDHSGDPGETDLETYTEYTEYLYLDNIQQGRDRETYNHMFFDIFGNEGDAITPGIVKGTYTIRTVVTTRAKAEGVKKFVKRHNSDDNPQVYLVWVVASDTYYKFYDHDITERSYVPIKFLDRVIIWQKERNMLWGVQLTVKTFWGDDYV